MRQLFDRPRATNGYGRNSRSFYQRTKNRSDGRDVHKLPLWVMKMPGFLVVLEAVRVQEQRSPFARLVILVEAGTHLIFDALICPYKMGERVRGLKLLRSVMPGMLLMWDRGLHSYAMVEATVSKGCEYLGRIPCNVKFLNETTLSPILYGQIKASNIKCVPASTKMTNLAFGNAACTWTTPWTTKNYGIFITVWDV